MSKFQPVRGMRDFLAEEAKTMRHIEQTAREIARLYGYEEIITPVVESYELLAAKAGEEMRHRMYAFEDLGGRKVALRAEFTPSVARLVATTLKRASKPLKLFCTGSLYRYDEPQYGRFREFWQANYELIGSTRPEADAEILSLSYDLKEKLGLRNCYFKIGHVGILRGILTQENIVEEQQNQIMQLLDKKQWNDALAVLQELGASQKCTKTMKNILETQGKDVSKVLKRAKEIVKDYESAVAAVDNLREIVDLAQEGEAKIELLAEMGFARGLEYYTGMIFEPYVPDFETALGGGGRYDKLVELFGGEPTPAVGVAHGMDRLALAMEKIKKTIKFLTSDKERVIVIPIGEKLIAKALELSSMLRKAGISVEVEVMGHTVSKALQNASKRGFTDAVIVGAEELKKDKVVLRDMEKREQKTVEIKHLVNEILRD
jgi:histidyl-tRNA synthetase